VRCPQWRPDLASLPKAIVGTQDHDLLALKGIQIIGFNCSTSNEVTEITEKLIELNKEK
jgi:hypothetical protein